MATPTLTLTTLRAQARFLALGDSASTSFSDDDTLVAANDAYQDLVVLAFRSAGDWQFRGNNKATTSITASTRSYALPTDVLRVSRVEIKYPSGDEYRKATQIDSAQLDTALDEYTTDEPQFDLVEGYLEIFVHDKTASISAVTSGILVYHDDDITALSGASDAPEIPQPFARLMAAKMAHYYCLGHEMFNKAAALSNEILKLEAEFIKFIANRSEAKKLSLRPRREDYGQLDLAEGGEGERSINP
jgi:hypothetical protein